MPLVVFAGAEYGNGSSRDWAAKGTKLLGVRAVIAESFERIHRSNLVGMGVLPLTFEPGTSWKSLGLKGDEQVTIHGLGETLKPRQMMEARSSSPTAARRKCRFSAASRRRTNSNISRTAASCPTCCASSPRRKHYPSRTLEWPGMSRPFFLPPRPDPRVIARSKATKQSSNRFRLCWIASLRSQ